MTNQEAIHAIKSNYPSKGTYTILCEALDLAIEALERNIPKDVFKKTQSTDFRDSCHYESQAKYFGKK